MSSNIEIATQLRAAQINTDLGPFWHASAVARVAGLSRIAPIPRGGASAGNGLLPRFLRMLIHRDLLDDPAIAQITDGDILIAPKAAKYLVLLLEGEPGVLGTAAIEEFFAARDVQLPAIPDVPDDPEPEAVPESEPVPEPELLETVGLDAAPVPAVDQKLDMTTYGSFDGINDIDFVDFEGARWLRAGPLCAAYALSTAGNLAQWLQRRSEHEFQHTRVISGIPASNPKDKRPNTSAIFLSRSGAELALSRAADRDPDQREHVESALAVLADMWDEFEEEQVERSIESTPPAPQIPAPAPESRLAGLVAAAPKPEKVPFAVPPAAVPPPGFAPAPVVPPNVPVTRKEFDELRVLVGQMRTGYDAVSGMMDSANTVKKSLDGATTRLRRELLDAVEPAVAAAVGSPEQRVASTIADHLQHEREWTGSLLAASERAAVRRAVEVVVELLGGVDPAEVERVLTEAGVPAWGAEDFAPAESKDAVSILATNAHERDVLIALCKSGPMHEDEIRKVLRSRGRRKLPETLFNLRARGVLRRDARGLWTADLSSVSLSDEGETVAVAN